MRIKRLILAVTALFGFIALAVAEAATFTTNVLTAPLTNAAASATNAVAALPAVADLTLSKTQLWALAISAITPLIVGLIYQMVPKIPKFILPAVTPLVGVVMGLVLNWFQKANLGWMDMAQAGALAVFVREVFNQATQATLAKAAAAAPAPTVTTIVLPTPPPVPDPALIKVFTPSPAPPAPSTPPVAPAPPQ